MATPAQIKAHAVGRARQLGFVCAGVAPADRAPHGREYRSWLDAGHHASMQYMARNVEKRCDVRAAWPWARSVLCLAVSHAPRAGAGQSHVARYARGTDYHTVLKRLCRTLADELTDLVAGLRCRTCVDTAPLLERDLADRAGVGWIGKNGCLIHPTFGSYLVLAEIVLSIELPPDAPMARQCGQCRTCLDACPNGALIQPRLLDARRCNSWATIENRDQLATETLNLAGHVFGCDVCQQVCPFNKDVPSGLAELTEPKPVAEASLPTILAWSPDQWSAATGGSAVRRASWEMLLRNAAVAAALARQAAATQPLRRLVGHSSAIVAGAAKWALTRLEGPGE